MKNTIKYFILGVLFTIFIIGTCFAYLIYVYKTGQINDDINKYFGISGSKNDAIIKNTKEFKIDFKNIDLDMSNEETNLFENKGDNIGGNINAGYMILKEKGGKINYIEKKYIKTMDTKSLLVIGKNKSVIKYIYKKFVHTIKKNDLLLSTYIYKKINTSFKDKLLKKKLDNLLFFYMIKRGNSNDSNVINYYYDNLRRILVDNMYLNLSLEKNLVEYNSLKKKIDKILAKIKLRIYNKTYINNYIVAQKYLNNNEDIEDFKTFLKNKQNLINEKIVLNDFCLESYCKSYKRQYMYVKKAIINDDELSENIIKYAKKYNIPENIFYTILIIENLRMHITYKTNFKKFFINLNIPKLGIMNKFSYGLYGLKLKILNDIVSSYYYENNIDDVQKSEKFAKLIKMRNNNKKIKYIVNNKDLQTEIVAIFLSYQRYKYHTNGCKKLDHITYDARKYNKKYNISNSVGIMSTLWNIGGAKDFQIKKCDPETGGSKLGFLSNITFGDLANIIDSSSDLLYIKNR